MRSRLLYVFFFVVIVSALYFAERYIDANDVTVTSSEGASETNSLLWGEDLLPKSRTRDVVFHEFYTLSYAESHEQAEWVAYELKPEHISNKNIRRPDFELDPKVRSRSAHWSNYKRSGYDRGHLCPAGDRRFSYKAYQETFLTSNISPQNHDFNSGIWNRLEQKVRRWAKEKGDLYIVTGGVLRNGLESIGSEKVTIPDAFYKVIIMKNGGGYEVIAFLVPNQPSSQSYFEYTISVDALEAVTGIDFFPQLPDDIENELEATSDFEWWQ